MKWRLLYWICHTAVLVHMSLADPAIFSPDTPQDGTIFPVFLNDVLYFNVNASHSVATDVKIIFRENPDMLGFDLTCNAVPVVNRTWCPPKTNSINCSCQLVDMYDSNNLLLRKSLVPNLGHVAAGMYGTVVRRFASMDILKVCFQALWSCDPITDSAGSNNSNTKCFFSSFGVLNPEFYPVRCVRIHVKQNPQVFSVAPAEKSQRNKTIILTEGDPMPPWRKTITTSKMLLNVGELLQLNVDAFDPNEGDDIDIGLTDDSVIPTSAVLGPRLCCSDDFAFCEETSFGSTKKTDVTRTTCALDSNSKPPASYVTSSCDQTCTQKAQPIACRAVRRVLTLVASDDMVGKTFNQIAFYAQDNSGILDNQTQTSNPSCCKSRNLQSIINVSVELQVQRSVPTFLDPTPPNDFAAISSPNCPIQAISINFYFPGNGGTFDIVPDGCVLGSVLPGEQKLCTASAVDCTCNPQWPQGVYLTQPTAFSWTPFNFQKRQDSSVFTWITQSVQVSFASGNSTIQVFLQANRAIPKGSMIAIGNISGFSSQEDAIPLNFSNCGGFDAPTVLAHWSAASKTLRFSVTTTSNSLNFRFSMPGIGMVPGWSISVDAPVQYSPYYWTNATYSVRYDSIRGMTTVDICVRANTLLPAQTKLVIRNLMGLSQANNARIITSLAGRHVVGELDLIMGSLTVTLVNPTYAIPLSFTLSGSAALDLMTAETDASKVDNTMFPPVAIPATRLQSSTGCPFSSGMDTLSGISRVGQQRVMRWTPTPAQAGKTYNICFRLGTTTGQMTPRRCYNIKIEKCKQCALVGDSWLSLANAYSSHWLQLWAANSVVRGPRLMTEALSPDFLQPGTVVRLGPLYTSDSDIAYSDLAKRYAISLDIFLKANPDFSPDIGRATSGQEICVIPATCDSDVAPDGSSSRL